jgi:hypothetical protein
MHVHTSLKASTIAAAGGDVGAQPVCCVFFSLAVNCSHENAAQRSTSHNEVKKTLFNGVPSVHTVSHKIREKQDYASELVQLLQRDRLPCT